MYKIFADSTLIYDSTLEEYRIGKGEITKESDKSGSFVFSLYPDHFYYDSFVKLKTVITVYKSGRIVFRGRVLNDVTDYWNNKVLTCEGELSFLQDSIARPYDFAGTPAALFRKFIEEHNSQVDEFKRFKLGSCTVVDANGYIARSNEGYESTLSNMTSRLLEDATGGHFYVTHGDDGTDEIPTIHYLADFTKTASQSIEFGANLKNYTKTVKAEEIATAIIPLGTEVREVTEKDPETGKTTTIVEETGNKLTIARVNSGKDYVYSKTGVELYGWIFKTVEWTDVTDPAILKTKAQAEVEKSTSLNVTVELTAVDLHLLDRSIESYNVSEYVPVYSTPHNFAAALLCNKQTLNLLKPENDTVTLGHTYATFTESSNKVLNRVSKVSKSSISSALVGSAVIVDIITRLDALEGVSVTVVVTDTQAAVASLLTSWGTLSVAGQAIIADSTVLTVYGGRAEVTYTLQQALDTARTVTVNGLELGTVSAPGDTVTATVAVSKGSELVIAFAS